MPTVFKYEGYRFYFYSNEHLPEHIHIESGKGYARIVLETLEVTDSYDLNSKELKKLGKMVQKNKEKIKGAWYEYFK